MAAKQPDRIKLVSRRQFMAGGSLGMASIALEVALNCQREALAENPPAHKPAFELPSPHFAPKAKHLIFLFMAGAPSQIDLFDYKPKLNQLDGKKIDLTVIAKDRFPNVFTRVKTPRLLGSPYKFKQHGQSGALVSELMPHLAEIVDDVTFIKSMHSDLNAIDHISAQLFLGTGALVDGRPSLGAWLSYGLGSENQDMPPFAVLVSNRIPRGGLSIYGSGFLPGIHQGVSFRGEGDPVLYLSNPPGLSEDARRRSVETINVLNKLRYAVVGDPKIATRISSFDMAHRMQSSVPQLMDITQEPPYIHKMYGTTPGKRSFANNCLLARRLVEKGVRTVQLVDLDWDHHGDTKKRDIIHALPKQCQSVDRAITALVRDLKQRNLLDETLVVFAGEFGRTPMNEFRNADGFFGRDHHPRAFTTWMAGGGVKAGLSYGQTDELGYAVTENPVHVHDLHATILHLMGLDHKRLTYRTEGRDFRLTDIAGRVVTDVLA